MEASDDAFITGEYIPEMAKKIFDTFKSALPSFNWSYVNFRYSIEDRSSTFSFYDKTGANIKFTELLNDANKKSLARASIKISDIVKSYYNRLSNNNKWTNVYIKYERDGRFSVRFSYGALESYLIPAMEAVNESLFNKVFLDKDYMNYKSTTAKVKGKSYDLSKLKYLKDVMGVVITAPWSESDFIKFIEDNIKYTGKGLEISYWAEDDTTDPLSERDKKNQKTWNNLKLICVSEDGGGNTLYYSKSKHGFYFIDHELLLEDNMKNFINWKDAIDGFKNRLNLKINTPSDYAENPDKYKDVLF